MTQRAFCIGSDSAAVRVTVEDVVDNTAPVAVDDSASTDEDTAIRFNVIDNDTDNEGDALSVIAFDTSGVDGIVEPLLSAGGTTSFSYDPNGAFEALNDGEVAEVTSTYTVSDGVFGRDFLTDAASLGFVTVSGDAALRGVQSTVIPVPASALLLGTTLIGFGALRRKSA